MYGERTGTFLRDWIDFDPRVPVREAVAALEATGLHVARVEDPTLPSKVAGRSPARLKQALVEATREIAAASGSEDTLLRVGATPAEGRYLDLHVVLAFRRHPEGPVPAPDVAVAVRPVLRRVFGPLGGVAEPVEAPRDAVAFGIRLRYHEPIGREAGDGLVILPDDGRNVAIGQGPVAVTPLQMVRAVAALANGGRLVTPHVVGWVDDVPVRTPSEDLHLDPADVARIREGMRRVIEEPGGTAYSAGFGSVPATVYGKTGTAQPGTWWIAGEAPPQGPWHHWFVGFATKPGRPTIAFACVLHARTEGAAGSTAAKSCARFLTWWFTEGPGAG